jgi:activator of HSP90 ATPase
MTEASVLKNIPKGWKRVPTEINGKRTNGWKLIDGNGIERIRFMRSTDETVTKWERMKSGYWERMDETGDNYLDELGNVILDTDPNLRYKSHIPYTGAD